MTRKWKMSGIIKSASADSNPTIQGPQAHTYFYGDGIMKDFLMRRLHSFTVLELRKLHRAQRATHYDQVLRNEVNISYAK